MPGLKALSNTSTSASVPMIDLVTKVRSVSLSAEAPAARPPVSPWMLSPTSGLSALLAEVISTDLASTSALAPIFAITVETTSCSTSAPAPARRPPETASISAEK